MFQRHVYALQYFANSHLILYEWKFFMYGGCAQLEPLVTQPNLPPRQQLRPVEYLAYAVGALRFGVYYVGGMQIAWHFGMVVRSCGGVGIDDGTVRRGPLAILVDPLHHRIPGVILVTVRVHLNYVCMHPTCMITGKFSLLKHYVRIVGALLNGGSTSAGPLTRGFTCTLGCW